MDQQAKLQWGRDLLVAESAAMAMQGMLADSLQWGRDLLVAESWRTNRARGRLGSFNGAATC